MISINIKVFDSKFLNMISINLTLTLLKGLMPHVPAMLPLLVSDPEMRFVIGITILFII